MLKRIAQAAESDASNPKAIQEKKPSGQKRPPTDVRSEDKRQKKDHVPPPSTRPQRHISKEVVTQAPLSFKADQSYSPSFPRGPLLPEAVQAAMKYPVSIEGCPLSRDAVAAQSTVSRLCKTNTTLEARFEALAMREKELTKQLTIASQTANDFAGELKACDKYNAELKAEMKRKDRAVEYQCKKLTEAEADSKAAKEALRESLQANSELRLKIIDFEKENVKLDKFVKRQEQQLTDAAVECKRIEQQLTDAATEYKALKEKSDESQKLLDNSDGLVREMIYFMRRDGDFSFLKEEEAKMMKYCEERLAKARSDGAGASGTGSVSSPVLETSPGDPKSGTGSDLLTSSAALEPTSSSALCLSLSTAAPSIANIPPSTTSMEFPSITTCDTSDITMAELNSLLGVGASDVTMGESFETYMESMPDMPPLSSLLPTMSAILTDSIRTSTSFDDDLVIIGSTDAPIIPGPEIIGAMQGIIDTSLLTPKTEKISQQTSGSKSGKSGNSGSKSLKIHISKKGKR